MTPCRHKEEAHVISSQSSGRERHSDTAAGQNLTHSQVCDSRILISLGFAYLAPNLVEQGYVVFGALEHTGH